MMERGAIVSICCDYSSFEVARSGRIFLLLAVTPIFLIIGKQKSSRKHPPLEN